MTNQKKNVSLVWAHPFPTEPAPVIPGVLRNFGWTSYLEPRIRSGNLRRQRYANEALVPELRRAPATPLHR